MKQFNIFSPSWIQVYGIPFSAGYGSNLDYTSIEFQCRTSQDLSVFKGVIVSINRNVIVVKEENTGETYTVHLSGCTRLETATVTELPAVGDSIHFRGEGRSSGGQHHYNAF